MNAICCLANNLSFLESLLKNIPDELKDVYFIIVNETRIGNKIEEINKLMLKSKIKNFKVFDSCIINKKVKDNIIDNKFVDDYTMSMNILMMWFVFKYSKKIDKCLFIDDDIILQKGIEKVFDSNESLFCKGAFGTSDIEKLNEKRKTFYKEMFDIFNFEFDSKKYTDYNKNKINSGQILIVRKDFNESKYDENIKKFFHSDIVYEVWKKRRTKTSYNIDEVFLTLFFYKNLNNKLKEHTFIIYSAIDKIKENDIKNIKKSKIIHIANNSHKVPTYELLKEREIIK